MIRELMGGVLHANFEAKTWVESCSPMKRRVRSSVIISFLAVAVSGLVTTPQILAQAPPAFNSSSATSNRPKFEVAAIKLCKPGEQGKIGPADAITGRLRVCANLRQFIQEAYVVYADGRF